MLLAVIVVGIGAFAWHTERSARAALLTGQGGPPVDLKFNLYYVDAWSLTHFMFHYANGKYARAYRQFLAQGATLDTFVSLIGPVEKIQAEWYPYLQAQSLSQPPPFPLP
jgi:hypothetical protein